VSTTFNRRGFLGRSLLVAGGVAGGGTLLELLTGCGSSSKSGTAPAGGGASGNLTTVGLQLVWIKNVEFAGSYIADDKGYYAANGITANLISGGATVPVEPVVLQGKALIGISNADATAAAVAKGAKLKIIATMFQKAPFCITSLASNPIKTPSDLAGKKIGVQAANESIWSSFLKANDIDPSKITKIPAQFDPTPLANKQVDGWFSYITNEPNTLKVKGVETATMLLNDFNYPSMSNVYVVTEETLGDKTKRDTVVKFMRAEIKGWQDNVKDPDLGARLAVDKYGKSLGLGLEEQTLENKAANELIQGPDTEAHGLFWMSDETIAKTVDTITKGGGKINKDLFTREILEEVYDGKTTVS
jgi:ABC-type nitrate/sulfonate/bicarbonate transport system substrate-binding protein